MKAVSRVGVHLCLNYVFSEAFVKFCISLLVPSIIIRSMRPLYFFYTKSKTENVIFIFMVAVRKVALSLLFHRLKLWICVVKHVRLRTASLKSRGIHLIMVWLFTVIF